MNRHALNVLEFARALDIVAGYASSALGARAVRERVPLVDREGLEQEQSRVFAMVALVRSDLGWSMPPIPDCAPALARLRVEGTLLAGSEMLSLGTLLRASRMTHEALGDTRRFGFGHPQGEAPVLATEYLAVAVQVRPAVLQLYYDGFVGGELLDQGREFAVEE